MDPSSNQDATTTYKSVKPFAQAKLLSLTEKCKICGDQAARHIHYGAMSCFSCRAFFRRSIQNKTAASYACRRFNKCDVNLRTRKNCQACRYQKCLDVGMNPSWVLTEEERKVRFKKSGHGGPEQGLVALASRPSTAKRHSTVINVRARASSDENRQDVAADSGEDTAGPANFSPPTAPSNPCPGSGSHAPSFGGFIKETPAGSALNKEMQIGAMIGDELVVGQGMIKEAKGQHNRLYTEIKTPVVVSTASWSSAQVKDEPVSDLASGRPSVQKVKDEPSEGEDGSFVFGNRRSAISLQKVTAPSATSPACSTAVTQNLVILDKPQQDIRDVLKDDPDFNNIDIDLIEASLMEDGSRQLRIDESLSDETGAGIRINDLVAQLSKSYDMSPPKDEDTDYDDDEDDDEDSFSLSRMLTQEEELYIENLVVTHNDQYKSVNFGEEMIKEMVMCSMFGIPISSDAAINGYKICVERITKIARNLKEFEVLTYEDQSVLLKENADLLVCLRGAIFFDPKKSGVDQVLVSMGYKDLELLNTMFSQAMKEVANMKHIEYKTFNSIQNVSFSAKETRYKYIQEKVGEFLEDDTITVLLTIIVLFSSDFCAQLQDPVLVSKTQGYFLALLQKYSNSKFAESGARLDSCILVAQCMEVVTMLREMADMKKARNLNIISIKV